MMDIDTDSRKRVVEDISSAEEETISRKRLKQKAQRTRAAARQLTKPSTHDDCKQVEDGAETIHSIRIRPLSDFANEHKYLTHEDPKDALAACDRSSSYMNTSMGSTGSNAFSALAQSLLPSVESLSTQPCDELINDTIRRCRDAHRQACLANPSEAIILEALLHRCSLPVYYPRKFVGSNLTTLEMESEDYDQAVSAKLESSLKRRQVSLPHFGARFEQDQLKEAGEWSVDALDAHKGKAKFQPCRNGENCVCNQMDFPVGQDAYRARLLKAGVPEAKIEPLKQRFVMMGFMFEDQLKAFIETGTTTGSPYPCILCVRDSLVQLDCYLKSIQASYDSSGSSDSAVPNLDIRSSGLGLFRNSVDCADGYFKAYCSGVASSSGSDNRPIINPIVALNRQSLSLRRDAEGRRSRQELEESVWHRRKAITRLFALFYPDLSRLRNKLHSSLNTFVFTPPLDPDADDREGLVDTWACESVMRDDYGSTREETYDAAVMLDLIRDELSPDVRNLQLSQAENPQSLCAPPTLPPMVSKALSIPFLEPLSVAKDPLTHMFGKGMNQKCMIRKFGKTALRDFKKDEETLVCVRQWLLCSLLGNYVHVRPSTRPRIQGRSVLYKWLGGFEVGKSDAFLRLTTLCPHLILFACREQLVYLMADIPALRLHFDTFSDYAYYRDIVVDCMDEVRHWFSSALELPSSPLHNFINGKPDTQYTTEFFNVVVDMLAVHHDRISGSNYKRPNSNSMSVIRSLKSPKLGEDAIGMMQMPDWRPDTEAKDVEALFAPLDGDEEEEKQDHACTAFDFDPYLPKSHVKAIDLAIGKLLECSLTPSQAFCLCLDVFEFCGLTRAQTQFVKGIVRDLQKGLVSKKESEKRFRVLQTTFPHAYNLLQAAAELMKEKQRFRVICQLPLNMSMRQLKTIQERFGCKGCDYLSDTLVFFFCPVCDCIYSLLRNFTASHVNNYRYGLRDALVDYTTREVYCRRSRVNHRGACGKQPLSRIPLVGVLIFYCNKRIMLCPQPGCGMAMVYDAKQGLFNEYGPMCYQCSHTARFGRIDYGIDVVTKCVKCNTSVPSSDRMYWYPHGAMLCNRCNKQHPQLAAHFHEPEAMARCRTRQQVIDEIWAHHRQKQQAKRDKMMPEWNQQRKRSRQESRRRTKR